MSRFSATHDNVADFPALPVDRHPDTLAWIARIEATRLEDAPKVCPTCGSRCGPKMRTEKTCPGCARLLPIDAFNRNRARRDGRGSWCAECASKAVSRWHSRRAIAAIRRAS